MYGSRDRTPIRLKTTVSQFSRDGQLIASRFLYKGLFVRPPLRVDVKAEWLKSLSGRLIKRRVIFYQCSTDQVAEELANALVAFVRQLDKRNRPCRREQQAYFDDVLRGIGVRKR